ncbi:hypothetical protein OHI65_13535 [Brucella sp. MAB-22]|uniref:hypothetical protein n=1 Tax=Brucella sp. MAB-22 TaxID=2986424 RepID=UPI00221EE3E7|nr:hypothetical protein [Brucella sp. MAB-22]UYT57509.1 hypothetical protein OHI65_13535 [Brucella sp. MAB-22]
MIDLHDLVTKMPIAKWSIILVFSLVGAIMQRDMTWTGRMITFSIGIAAAVVFAEPVRLLLSLDASWSDALSAVLAMTGRNWAAYFVRATGDPTKAAREILEIWRNRR